MRRMLKSILILAAVLMIFFSCSMPQTTAEKKLLTQKRKVIRH